MDMDGIITLPPTTREIRMIGSLPWRCPSLKSLCAVQCVDLDGAQTIEAQPTL